MSTIKVENLTGITSGSNANKIIVPSGQTLDASAATLVPSTGQVIQKEAIQWNVTTENSTETYADINSGTIDFTPKDASSLLFITVHFHLNAYTAGNYAGGAIRILHDGSVISTQSQYEVYWQSNVGTGTTPNNYQRGTKFVRHPAGNTATRTIKLQMAKYGGTTTAIRLNQGALFQSALVVEEIAQ
jgi:hypothetical protein